MSIPIPDIHNLPGAVEVQARGIHAQHLRNIYPDVSDREVLDGWDAFSDEARQQLLAEAQRRIEERLQQPGTVDTPESLAARFGMTPDDLRAAAAEARERLASERDTTACECAGRCGLKGATRA